jgi:hypothetical protein
MFHLIKFMDILSNKYNELAWNKNNSSNFDNDKVFTSEQKINREELMLTTC